MALKKDITSDNGIVLGYHRIVAIHVITNNDILIEVNSYIAEEYRQIEATALTKDKPFNIYTMGSVYNMPYSETVSVATAYEFLKEHISDFTGSVDV